jgi:hypothetical protein
MEQCETLNCFICESYQQASNPRTTTARVTATTLRATTHVSSCLSQWTYYAEISGCYRVSHNLILSSIYVNPIFFRFRGRLAKLRPLWRIWETAPQPPRYTYDFSPVVFHRGEGAGFRSQVWKTHNLFRRRILGYLKSGSRRPKMIRPFSLNFGPPSFGGGNSYLQTVVKTSDAFLSSLPANASK